MYIHTCTYKSCTVVGLYLQPVEIAQTSVAYFYPSGFAILSEFDGASKCQIGHLYAWLSVYGDKHPEMSGSHELGRWKWEQIINFTNENIFQLQISPTLLNHSFLIIHLIRAFILSYWRWKRWAARKLSRVCPHICGSFSSYLPPPSLYDKLRIYFISAMNIANGNNQTNSGSNINPKRLGIVSGLTEIIAVTCWHVSQHESKYIF